MRLHVYLMVFVIFSAISCNNNKIKLVKNLKQFDHFSQQSSVKFSKIKDFTYGEIREMIAADSFLVVSIFNRNGGNMLYNLDLKTGDFSEGYLQRGKGPEEVLSVFSMGHLANNFWTFDYVKQRLTTIKYNKNIMQPDSFSITMHKINGERLVNVSFLGEGQIVGQIQNNKFKSAIVDYKSDLNYKYVNKWFELPTNKEAYVQVANHQLRVKPSGDKIAYLYLLTDVLEIYDIKKQSSFACQGPECFDIAYKSKPSKGDFAPKYEILNEARSSFLSSCATDKYIYAVYSGELLLKSKNAKRGYGNCIFVYDWNGNPVRKLDLDRYIRSIAVSNDDSILYAYDVNEGTIVKSDLF
ncbi:hypothetical protein DMA11_21305 [Marinilabiliaceae bacterium JC017]|nr:hypothetical protein DMA11_21305 [Marinilabiliaceae bacterium JC017]